jgi:hypothetical protein
MSNTHAKFCTLADLEKQRLEILKQQWVKKSENPMPQKPEEAAGKQGTGAMKSGFCEPRSQPIEPSRP